MKHSARPLSPLSRTALILAATMIGPTSVMGRQQSGAPSAPPTPAATDFGKDFKELTPQEATDFQKQIDNFKGVPKKYADYLAPWLDGVKLKNRPRKVDFDIIFTSEVQRRDVVFRWIAARNAPTPLAAGFSLKAIVTNKDQTQNTYYMKTTDAIRNGATRNSVVLHFARENLRWVDFIIMPSDGKDLLKADIEITY